MQLGYNNLMELLFALSGIVRVDKMRDDYVVFPASKEIHSEFSSPYVASREASPPMVCELFDRCSSAYHFIASGQVPVPQSSHGLHHHCMMLALR